MKVFLASAGIPEDGSCIPAFRELAQSSDRHVLASDPESADVVLFTECHLLGWDWRLQRIRDTAVARRFPGKTYVYDERDRPWCTLPGSYVSMPAFAFREDWQVPASYYQVSEPWERVQIPDARRTAPDLLFSFIGSRTHPCREAIFELSSSRSVIECVDDGFAFFDPSSTNFAARTTRFAEIVYRSKFVLCPRGRGTSSIRLYETMAAGRVPVIIADNWVPPTGPDWNSFSIRWPERRIDELPELLHLLEPRAGAMGALAHEEFETWFAPRVSFDTLMDGIERLHQHRLRREFPSHGIRNLGYANAALFGVGTRVRHWAAERAHRVLDGRT